MLLAAAISSSDGSATLLVKLTTPKAAAARTASTAPSGVMVCSEPIGAMTRGMRRRWPSNVVPVSISETSRSTRGRNARHSSPSRLRLQVTSVPAAPSM